ncbi:MAG: hypothetical protein M3448_09125 [Pseudomonadota bacterium]|nr:hypothetical protein [Pseudomonadota bacterium]
MFRFFFLVMAAAGLTMLFALAAAVRRPLARLLRATLLGIVTLLAVTGFAAIVAGVTSDSWWAAIIGGAIMLLALRLGWPLARPRRRNRMDELKHVPLTRSAPDPRWRHFDSSLDWVSRRQSSQARTAIEGFIAERDSQSLTHEHKALLVSLERRVPELIDTCLDRCRNANRTERQRYMDETLDRITQIGAEAERARLEIRRADDQRLQVLHRYFDDVVGDGDGQRGAR